MEKKQKQLIGRSPFLKGFVDGLTIFSVFFKPLTVLRSPRPGETVAAAFARTSQRSKRIVEQQLVEASRRKSGIVPAE